MIKLLGFSGENNTIPRQIASHNEKHEVHFHLNVHYGVGGNRNIYMYILAAISKLKPKYEDVFSNTSA